MIPSVTALVVSCQVILGTFFLSILGIKHTRHPVTASVPSVPERAGEGPSPQAAKPAGSPQPTQVAPSAQPTQVAPSAQPTQVAEPAGSSPLTSNGTGNHREQPAAAPRL